MDKLLSEALRLLKWAADDFDKHRISNDAWRGEYNNFIDYDVNDHRNKQSEGSESYGLVERVSEAFRAGITTNDIKPGDDVDATNKKSLENIRAYVENAPPLIMVGDSIGAKTMEEFYDKMNGVKPIKELDNDSK